MAYDGEETSVSSGEPIECYKFDYYDMSYCYTSSQYAQQIDGVVYNPEYIKRGDTLKLGDSGGTVETCTITVPRTTIANKTTRINLPYSLIFQVSLAFFVVYE